MRMLIGFVVAMFAGAVASGAPLNCDLAQYTPQDGLTASVESGRAERRVGR